MKNVSKWISCTIALVLGFIGAFVAATWTVDRPVSALQERWAPPPSTFISVGGMNVHLRDEGPHDDALPLVLLHGTSASLHTWDGWVETLKPHHRVIRFDLPGFGLTGPTPDNIYSLDRYADIVVGVLDKLGVSRCIIAGNSLGGNVAWYTAVQHPERFEKLVLIDAAGYPYQSVSMPIGFRLAKIPVLRDISSYLLPRNMLAASVRNVYGDPSNVTEAQIDRYYDLTLREGNRKALVERFRQMPPGEAQEKIAELKLPTLILWGGKDQLIPQEYAERFHQDIAGSQVKIFESLGHIPHEEDPQATVAVVQNFLSRQGSQTGL